MKKFCMLLLSMVLIFCLVSCDKTDAPNPPSDNPDYLIHGMTTEIPVKDKKIVLGKDLTSSYKAKIKIQVDGEYIFEGEYKEPGENLAKGKLTKPIKVSTKANVEIHYIEDEEGTPGVVIWKTKLTPYKKKTLTPQEKAMGFAAASLVLAVISLLLSFRNYKKYLAEGTQDTENNENEIDKGEC